MIDLDALGKTLDARQIEQMHRMKTGALLRASVLMGARAGHLDPPVLGQLGRYAEAIGLAFQIVDDILDVESSSAEMGKTVGKDQAQNKSTYVSVLGMAAAKQRAAQLRDVAGLALEQTGLGPVRTMRMAQLADLIVARRN